MSTEQDKFKNSKRRHRDEAAIAKQVKIGKAYGHTQQKYVKEPHRLVKHHLMDCGRPGCILCSNPRRTFKELTMQEKRSLQSYNETRNTHNNGFPPNDIW